MGFCGAAADASAELVKLGQAEAFGMLDDHGGGVGDVDADFDDGGGDEDLDFVFAEALHDVVFFFAGEAAVEEPEFQFRKDIFREPLELVDGSFQLELRFFDDGIDDVGLMAGGDFAAEKFPDAWEMRLGGEARLDGSAAGGKFVEDGNVEVAVESERESAWDGRGGEDEDVRRVAVGGSFIHEAFALEDAETVLLVDGDEAEARELDLVFDERVRADDELGFAGADAFEGGGFFGVLEAADEELDAMAAGGEDAAGGKIVLHGENFRGRHEGGLAAVFDGDDGGLERDDGLAAADVALEETIHGSGLFKVGGDFRQDTLLRGGGFEGKDTFERFADFFFADTEGDSVLLARGFTVERQAELVEKKFFEDEALLRGSAENVEGFEGFFGRGEVDVDQGFAARRIAETRAQSLGENVGHVRIEELDGGVHRAANLARAKRADGFVNGNDAADFGGVRLVVAEHLELRIDHFEAGRAELVNFDFAVKDQLLAGFEAAFEIATVKKFAGEKAAGSVLHKQMINGVRAELIGDGLTAHYAGANGVRAVGLDVLDIGKMNAILVTERQIGEQILERADAALGEELGALRADALDHAHIGCQAQSH